MNEDPDQNGFAGDRTAFTADRRAWWQSLAFCTAFVATLSGALAVNIAGNAEQIFAFGVRKSQNERAWKARRLREKVATGAPPGALILGSSRMMAMSTTQVADVTGVQAFNFAVRGGDPVEFNAMFRYAINVGACPKVLILNVDENMFVGDGNAHRIRLAGDMGLFRALTIKEQSILVFEIVRRLNLRSTLKSARALFYNARSDGDASVLIQGHGILFDDGQFVSRSAWDKRDGTFDLSERIESLIQKEAKARAKWPDSNRPGQPDFRQDQSVWEQLGSLLDAAHAMGVATYVVTTPVHPSAVGSVLGEDGRYLGLSMRSRLRLECEKRDVTYRDFSQLESFNGKANDFLDGIHQDSANMNRMLAALFKIPPATERELKEEEDALLRTIDEKWGPLFRAAPSAETPAMNEG